MEKKFAKGEIIFRQGEDGRCFYEILDGAVEIAVNYGEEGEHKLADLTAGQFFGEMAVIECYPRSATAVAGEEGVTVEEIDQSAVRDYLGAHPENIMKLMKNLGTRLRDLTASYNEVSALIRMLHLDDEEAKKDSFSGKARKHILFFKTNKTNADAPSAESLRMSGVKYSDGFAKKVVKYPKGTIICREGETGDCMYGIHWGTVGVYTGYGTDDERKLTDMAPNTFFGELGMVLGEPRTATVIALEDDTTVELIFPDDLEELFEKNPPKVIMILQHLSYRLRKLTDKYLAACSIVYNAISEAEKVLPMSDELKGRVSSYRENPYV